MRDLINQIKTSHDPNYCQRVTANDGVLGEQYLRDFQDNEKSIPTILALPTPLVRNLHRISAVPAQRSPAYGIAVPLVTALDSVAVI